MLLVKHKAIELSKKLYEFTNISAEYVIYKPVQWLSTTALHLVTQSSVTGITVESIDTPPFSTGQTSDAVLGYMLAVERVSVVAVWLLVAPASAYCTSANVWQAEGEW